MRFLKSGQPGQWPCVGESGNITAQFPARYKRAKQSGEATTQLRCEWGLGEWIHVYVWLSPFAVHLKLSQHC